VAAGGGSVLTAGAGRLAPLLAAVILAAARRSYDTPALMLFIASPAPYGA
jgi:hypothetical protein